MNTNHLSERLAMVASFVPQDTVLADIGSDHAYLPCYLKNIGKIQRAVAGEVVKGPFESARRNVQLNGFSDHIEVRLANGLQAIEPADKVETVTIAGMGGTLITTILQDGMKRLDGVKRIVAQPNIHAIAIRQWAVKNGFLIADEEILQEDGKIYEVVVLERGIADYSDADLLVGPILRKKNSDVFQAKWEREMHEWKRVIRALEQAERTEEIQKKKTEIEQKIELVRKVLTA
ncbi:MULTISPECIES: tRNA (adenine(22)-N(1))-methyltransferase TrmK [unclassified Sporosarcina]|uniref:tRNA (adenine(22)-N(1))-methyltransferase n=1 Tax=unclassified Sporosarcina TaxID=2647733 RepID=UPI00203B72B5|nr:MULTISPECIES: tRNA (adenine(22)-N(1))-methyltransferase TrmK [unclassified Sporosarcina]GKV64632.1 SAM-dependent methyltransferase [Sporosarcina sp. NCCP-2331]GLB54495.1 SAM-dependent methyltransferase [Sporosarcina sp. NCCP-2378]